MRNDRRRRIAAIPVDHHLDAVGGQHLEGAHEGRLGQRVGVHPHEERTVDPVRLAIRADGLRDGQNVRLVEGALERRAAVPRRPERDALGRDGRIGVLRVVRGHQSRDVDQHRGWSRRSGKRTDLHHLGTNTLQQALIAAGVRSPSTSLRRALTRRLPRGFARSLPWRHLPALFTRLAQPDRDRLLAALDRPARSALERALLFPAHRRFHTLRRRLSVLRHVCTSACACSLVQMQSLCTRAG